MNNEPVAYLMVERNDGNSYIQMGVPTRDEKISHQPYPLYTYPAKESKAKDRFSNYESICLQCGTTIYKPSFKTLTDEEITDIAKEHIHQRLEGERFGYVDFARAILRKAQEK
jgi:hypothetical protein